MTEFNESHSSLNSDINVYLLHSAHGTSLSNASRKISRVSYQSKYVDATIFEGNAGIHKGKKSSICLLHERGDYVSIISVYDTELSVFQVRSPLEESDRIISAYIVSQTPLLLLILSHRGYFIVIDVTSEEEASRNSSFESSHTKYQQSGELKFDGPTIKFMCKLVCGLNEYALAGLVINESKLNDLVSVSGNFICNDGSACKFSLKQLPDDSSDTNSVPNFTVLVGDDELDISTNTYSLLPRECRVIYITRHFLARIDGLLQRVDVIQSNECTYINISQNKNSIEESSNQNVESESDDENSVWKDCDTDEDVTESAKEKTSNKFFSLLLLKNTYYGQNSNLVWRLDSVRNERLPTKLVLGEKVSDSFKEFYNQNPKVKNNQEVVGILPILALKKLIEVSLGPCSDSEAHHNSHSTWIRSFVWTGSTREEILKWLSNPANICACLLDLDRQIMSFYLLVPDVSSNVDNDSLLILSINLTYLLKGTMHALNYGFSTLYRCNKAIISSSTSKLYLSVCVTEELISNPESVLVNRKICVFSVDSDSPLLCLHDFELSRSTLASDDLNIEELYFFVEGSSQSWINTLYLCTSSSVYAIVDSTLTSSSPVEKSFLEVEKAFKLNKSLGMSEFDEVDVISESLCALWKDIIKYAATNSLMERYTASLVPTDVFDNKVIDRSCALNLLIGEIVLLTFESASSSTNSIIADIIRIAKNLESECKNNWKLEDMKSLQKSRKSLSSNINRRTSKAAPDKRYSLDNISKNDQVKKYAPHSAPFKSIYTFSTLVLFVNECNCDAGNTWDFFDNYMTMLSPHLLIINVFLAMTINFVNDRCLSKIADFCVKCNTAWNFVEELISVHGPESYTRLNEASRYSLWKCLIVDDSDIDMTQRLILNELSQCIIDHSSDSIRKEFIGDLFERRHIKRVKDTIIAYIIESKNVKSDLLYHGLRNLIAIILSKCGYDGNGTGENISASSDGKTSIEASELLMITILALMAYTDLHRQISLKGKDNNSLDWFPLPECLSYSDKVIDKISISNSSSLIECLNNDEKPVISYAGLLYNTMELLVSKLFNLNCNDHIQLIYSYSRNWSCYPIEIKILEFLGLHESIPDVCLDLVSFKMTLISSVIIENDNTAKELWAVCLLALNITSRHPTFLVRCCNLIHKIMILWKNNSIPVGILERLVETSILDSYNSSSSDASILPSVNFENLVCFCFRIVFGLATAKDYRSVGVAVQESPQHDSNMSPWDRSNNSLFQITSKLSGRFIIRILTTKA